MPKRGIKRIQPMFIPKALSNMAARNIALRIGARGVCKSITTACSSNDAINCSFREIKFGYHDVILAGGAESAINEIGIGGFNALTALSTTEDPAHSAIPFDKDRNGFVMGEGAGVLVLEKRELKNVVQQSLLKLLVMVATVTLITKQHQHQTVLVRLKRLNWLLKKQVFLQKM